MLNGTSGDVLDRPAAERAGPTASAVALRGVRKSFGQLQVIHGVDIDIAPGEFVILVGPSGCGKSTLLRMIAGLSEISGGDVLIGGTRVNALEPKERDIAMVFQNYALYPQMTVAQNMGFALRMAGLGKAEIARKVRGAAEILGLEPLLGRKPAELSGGQRQRVAMGRAIVRNPKVFLFDEPLSNLDAKLRVQMRAEIKALHDRLGSTIIYVTHDQLEAMTMADKVVVMRGGKVEQAGAPLELYDRPANIFVAGFIGSPSMNFFRGMPDPGAGGLRLEDGSLIPLPRLPAQAPGRGLVLGIRPESIALDGSGGVPARILVTEPTGAETHVIARIAGQDCACLLRERVELRPGSTVGLRFDAAAAHFFDPETEQRLS
ncbi:ABC transporter ATP-binding protein [Poseidonocella sp. HB161398]|uniref:ABC transporter ATP-binding protein n=1 Tax=Poseidonocella sp. HB161398 TaxID=2320855 RepID=UPI0011093EF5|nr:sn-glycerol-3-phosphate ABC transporter ATP-binding protein UgpC [Poseidonocella sp. HB161398]